MMTDKNETSRLARVGAWLFLGALAIAMPSGCGPHRGPMEQVGHDVDQAAGDVSESVDEATH